MFHIISYCLIVNVGRNHLRRLLGFQAKLASIFPSRGVSLMGLVKVSLVHVEQGLIVHLNIHHYFILKYGASFGTNNRA